MKAEKKNKDSKKIIILRGPAAYVAGGLTGVAIGCIVALALRG